MDEKVATQVIAKYLKKGNMARCMRDILPSSNLSKTQRQEVADLVHMVVRWKRLFEHIIETQGLSDTAESYVRLAKDGVQGDAASYPLEYRYSCSHYVAQLLKNHEEWAGYLNETPPTTVCVNLNKSSLEEVVSILQEESLSAQRSVLPTAVLTSSVGKYSKIIQEHYAHVQDESSQLVSFLTAELGTSIFDFCAGNGGKSLAMASITKNKKNLSAYEINSLKRATLRQRCSQYAADVIVEETLPKIKYDLVLVDAPCTGLGAARRNPEAKYIDGTEDLPQTQASLLAQAARFVKSAGVLFYAVCTITPEETSDVIEEFIFKSGFSLVSDDEIPYHEYLLKDTNGFFTKIPQGDLFYLSVLRKTS